MLTLNGGRATYKLRNQRLAEPGPVPYGIRDTLARWAEAKRGKVKAAGVPRGPRTPEAKRRRREEQVERHIARLERDAAKIRPWRPSNPSCKMGDDEYGEHTRRIAAAWHAERPMRRALAHLAGAKLVHGEPRTWAEFYRQVEAIAGRAVRYRHDRECNRTGGPTRDEYLRRLYSYVGMDKPRMWEDTRRLRSAETLDRYREARKEYFADLRAKAELTAQIAERRSMLADEAAADAAIQDARMNTVPDATAEGLPAKRKANK